MFKPLFFFIIILCLLSCNNSSDLENYILRNQIRKEVLDSIKQAESNKVVLYSYKLKKGEKILLYNNKTWEYDNIPKSKSINHQPLGFSQAVTKSNNKIQKQTKTTSDYSTSSGYCGHPTKAGGSCRRKVKSGGYCWQHS